MSKHLLSQIPAINKILLLDEIKELMNTYTEVAIKSAIKQYIEEIKQAILNEELSEVPSLSKIVGEVARIVEKEDKNSLRRVINATGILHTNLGRSLLSEKIKENIESVAFNYSNLEFDIDNKKRGSRYVHLIDIIKKLTGAEDVLVVNNNAAAVLLTLNTLVKDQEIIVSRGELVEIGGAFRIPEIIKLSGGVPVEVGTTNKTHLKDYENAISEETGVAFDPSTVQHMVTIASNNLSKGLAFGVLDVDKREITWLELPLSGPTVQWLNYGSVELLLQQLRNKPTIGELLQLKAKAQGIEITTNKDEADMVYDYNWALDVAQVSNTLL